VAQIQPRQRRFDSVQRLLRGAILRLGYPMEVFGTVIISEHLPGVGKQGRDVFPDPRGAIPHDTQPHLLKGNQGRVFDLLEGRAEVGLALYRMPTQQMGDALAVH